MSEHAKVNTPQKTNNVSALKQSKNIPIMQGSHPSAIIQRAQMCPESLTHTDVMQLQRTIGNRAVIQLFKDIGLMKPVQKNKPVDATSSESVIQKKGLYDLQGVSERIVTDALSRIKGQDFDLWFRLGYTMDGLDRLIDVGKIGVNGSLVSLIHSVLSAETELKKISEDLSELEHLVDLPAWEETAGPAYVGAKTGKAGEHTGLPPLDVPAMEVDAYYMGSDNVLHVDEVKDTPRAFASKVKKDGKQVARQVKWLDNSTHDPNREVGYYINKTGPNFDEVLDPTVIKNLKPIAAAQDYKGFLNFDLEEMTVDELEVLRAQAFAHLKRDETNRMKPEYYTVAFQSLESTRETLRRGD